MTGGDKPASAPGEAPIDPVLREMLATGLTSTPEGGRINLVGGVDPAEAAFLARIVASVRPTTSVEIGMAMGVSALAICGALPKIPGVRHIVIDPLQNCFPLWAGIGLHNLRQAGHAALIDFIEVPSFMALPRLQAAGRKIDFAFIDGCHAFDHVFVDLFYIDKLLRVGGVVAFDDVDWPPVRRAIRYVLTNMSYRVVGTVWGDRGRERVRRRLYNLYAVSVGRLLKRACRIPSGGRHLARVFGAELLGLDSKYGLCGSCIALRKEAVYEPGMDYRPEDFEEF